MTEYNDNIEEIEDDDQQLYEHFRFEADPGQQPVRVDKFMCEKLQHSSDAEFAVLPLAPAWDDVETEDTYNE